MDRQTKISAADTQAQKRLQTIYRTLRDRIIVLTYPPGKILKEADIAKEFGLSRTPIRQALQKLQFEGLVETINAVGTIVTGYDNSEMEGLMAFRVRIEEIVGELALRTYSANDLSDMETLIERTESLQSDKDLDEYWRIANAHHELLGRVIETDALREIYDNLYYRTARRWFVVVTKMWEPWIALTLAEFNETIRSMRSGDTKGVMLVRRNYISNFAFLIKNSEKNL